MPKQEVAFLRAPATLLRHDPGARPVLFDGVTSQSWGDGSVIYAEKPSATLEIHADSKTSPIDALDDFLEDHLQPNRSVGALVALSYDLKHWIERLDRRHPWPAVPVLYAATFDWAYKANRRDQTASVVATTAASLQRGTQRIGAAHKSREGAGQDLDLSAPEPLMRRTDYSEMIRAAVEYIRAGDIYQANLAQAFRLPLAREHGPELFRRWTTRYPTPYAVFAEGGDWSILCNSPECFLDIHGDSIATFPIKGTRGFEPGDDVAAIGAVLSADPKERAEHIMIVDLERNDLGRLCEPGSIRVPELQQVCEFPMLVHMISEIYGHMRPGLSTGDILRATFPGGSITGAPKIRAMQIIEELEPMPRGFYTGSIGWIEPGGRTRFNIAIRTAVLDGQGLTFHAGGGIVADSDPQREYDETHAKSQSLFRVLQKPLELSLT